MSIRVSEKGSQRVIATISEQDLDILTGYMEEESSRDQDYFVDATTVDAIAELGASAELVASLRSAIGTSEGIDIVWTRD